MNDPTTPAPIGGNDDDGDVRAAFDELRVSATRLDTAAARRRLETASPPAGTSRWAPGLALATVVAVAGLGIGYLATRDDSTQVTTETPVADGADDASGDAADVASSDPLDGSAWTLVDGVELVEGWPITVTFDAGSVGGTSACNDFGATYRLDGSSLSIGPLDTTGAACEPAVMDSERAFDEALEAVDRYQLDGDQLTLSGDGVDDLVFTRLEGIDEADLVDITWVLESYTDSGEVVEAGGSGAFLQLDSDGALRAGTGCRPLTGQWLLPSGGAEVAIARLEAGGECEPDLVRQDNQVVTVIGDGFTAEVEGERLTLISQGDERLVYRRATAGDEVAEPAGDCSVDLVPDESLTWDVILVENDDVLYVRAEPGAGNEIVGQLAPDATDIVAGTQVVDVNGGQWRPVRVSDTVVGWANERFLAASPSDHGPADDEAMLAAAEDAIAWLNGTGGSGPGTWLSPTGLWLGGIGVFADLPFAANRIPATSLAGRQGWTTPIDFGPYAPDVDCGDRCLVSPLDFVKLPEPGRDYDLVVDEVLLADTQEGPAGTRFLNGAVESLQAMHHVTIDVPATSEGDLDWQRIHLFFDWRTGEPLLHAIYTWGWTP
jgi:heat shock protein HslJ